MTLIKICIAYLRFKMGKFVFFLDTWIRTYYMPEPHYILNLVLLINFLKLGQSSVKWKFLSRGPFLNWALLVPAYFEGGVHSNKATRLKMWVTSLKKSSQLGKLGLYLSSVILTQPVTCDETPTQLTEVCLWFSRRHHPALRSTSFIHSRTKLK